MNKILLKVGFASLASVLAFLPASLTAERVSVINSGLEINHNQLVSKVIVPAIQVKVQPKLHHHRKAHADLKVVSHPHKPAYLCQFTGRAFLNGQPYGNAKISIWITSPRIEETRTLTTRSDGTYNVNFAMDGVDNEPVDWEIRGLTADMKTFKMAGRRILVQGEHLISIVQPVEFLAD